MRFAFLVSAIALVATVATASAQSIGGKYRVAGTNLNGSRYSGTAEIVATGGATCRIAWTTGGTTAKGICMRQGGTLAAAYVMGGAIWYAMGSEASWFEIDTTHRALKLAWVIVAGTVAYFGSLAFMGFRLRDFSRHE